LPVGSLYSFLAICSSLKILNIMMPYNSAFLSTPGVYLRALKMCLYNRLAMNVHSDIDNSQKGEKINDHALKNGK
jgi:hypothetical protein